ncbi:metallophosphoesterase [Chryseobacterium rhizosphaerae]|uniref:metallophosphoesterase n=1 Tax=Chryseobacterium rhizosphaerae TaxID=395937 RepID=UPI0023596959|nr:metallophosphoesterase [Chryseobacterium rhizosphaerae]MDC8099729.1 metallophosphoesterase [Chryseobacterium rhizosphaerae]
MKTTTLSIRKIMHFNIKNPVPVSIKISVLGILLQSCATYNIQKGKNIAEVPAQDSSKVAHQLLLIGNIGNSNRHLGQNTLKQLQNRLNSAPTNSTLLFLGDNIDPGGMPDKNNKEYKQAKSTLEDQLRITQNYKGKTVVIPGNHDWKHGIKGLKNQEKTVTQYLDNKKAFLPKNGCPIDKIKLEDNITLITIDSQWFLENWENESKINAACNINSRDDFFAEFEGLINKNQNNLIVVALHHPLISKGIHAGYFSWKDQLYPLGNQIPLPVLGTLINVFRSTSSISPQDMNNIHYAALTSRIKSIVQNNNNVIFVSGHDHNLQYLEEKNVRQIISGAGSENGAAKVTSSQDFSFGGNGYAVLDINQDGSANVAYYDTKNDSEKLLTKIQVLKKAQKPGVEKKYPEKFPKNIVTSVYPESLTKKSKLYTWLWGEHYRKYYSTPIQAKVATLDTLKGGLSPVRAGGGHQSNSLRLIAQNGQEYAMRGVKKSAIRFLNAVAFKNSSFGSDFEETVVEKFLLDFYTTGHPYTPFAIENLAEKINVLHSNSQLYYIPKQKALGEFNNAYGDELYQIEERLSGSDVDLKQLNGATTTMNTSDMMMNLQKSEKYSVDQQSYIRARVFDMLIGDWDRHDGQWRWAEYKENDRYIYKPIPKDRDQAFSKYDGAIFKFIMMAPPLRHMQSFKEDIRDVKWMNREPYPLDLAFLRNATEQDWKKEAEYIQQNLSDKVIDGAFRNLPKEIQDETIQQIQQTLKIRRDKMVHYATDYYKALQKTVLLTGTNKQDRFVIKKEKDKISISQYRIKKEGDELVFQREYPKGETKEIWVYGLDDNDVFDISGAESTGIKVRIVGGQNHDVYNVQNGRNIKLYDFKSQNNTYNLTGHTAKKITDEHEINTYDYKKPLYNFWAGYPSLSYNPDEGVKIGAVVNYTQNGFEGDPYTAKHTFNANYLTATSGLELIYNGNFPNAIGKWAFNLRGRFTTPNFAQNYFGFGNNTIDNKDQLSIDYNRVRMQQLQVTPSFSKKSFLGLVQTIQLGYEDYKVKYTPERFIAQSGQIDSRIFDSQKFVGAKYIFSYDHSDNAAFPTMGFGFALSAAWKTNLEDTQRNFMTYEGLLNIAHRIDSNGRFVLATKVHGKYINNDNFDFFQGADLGGNNGLRSFRNYRFLGRSSLFQSSEIRWNFGHVKNGVAPMDFGILAGYDYGRVWMDDEYSRKWHQSVGGGIWVSALETLSIRATYFTGSDGGRFTAGAGFWF